MFIADNDPTDCPAKQQSIFLGSAIAWRHPFLLFFLWDDSHGSMAKKYKNLR